MNKTEQNIYNILQPIVASENLYLENVKLHRAGKYTTLRVVVDLITGTAGIGCEQIDTVTPLISQELDRVDPIKEAYSLEVMSPGADRKLTTVRHYERAVGRLLSLVLVSGEKITARLMEVQAENFTFVPESMVNHKKVIQPVCNIMFTDIRKARVVVELQQFDAE